MDERLRQTVRERAGYRCEYCCLPQDAEPFFAITLSTSSLASMAEETTAETSLSPATCGELRT
jgi:hypothetical protein